MRQLSFNFLAEEDLESIADFIAQDNPGRALAYAREIRAQCQRIAANPFAYRLRPDLQAETRSCVFGKYVIYFEVDGQSVTILRIRHGAQDRYANWVHDDPALQPAFAHANTSIGLRTPRPPRFSTCV